MIETVAVALLMFVNGEIKEHRIQESMSVCLKHKREATRQVKDNIDYKCIKSKVELETNIDGSKSIKKIILD
jgi:membrane-bound inhibitor of C-type lysozyme